MSDTENLVNDPWERAQEMLICPMCGKRKRGWRTQDENILCWECDEEQERQRKRAL